MANPEHLQILKQGVEAWHRWRMQHNRNITPDLSEANLNRTDLSRANLHKANLRGASLGGTGCREPFVQNFRWKISDASLKRSPCSL